MPLPKSKHAYVEAGVFESRVRIQATGHVIDAVLNKPIGGVGVDLGAMLPQRLRQLGEVSEVGSVDEPVQDVEGELCISI